MDVSKELYENINKSYLAGIRRDKNLAALAKKAQEGNATYKDVYDTAESLGQALATAFQKNLSSAVLPDGKMYYNIAKSVVEPFLQDNQQKVIDYAIEVQNALNDAAGIGIRGVNIGIDQDTIDGIINRLSSEDNYDEVSWILDDPVVTNAMKTVDRCVDANVDFAGASGLSPRVTRVTVGRCCDWCEEVAGVYEYPDVPKDVYRRHENCRCIVEYSPGNGKKQNVWSKSWQDSIIYNVQEPGVRLSSNLFGDDRRLKLAAYSIETKPGYNHIFIHGDSQSVQITQNGKTINYTPKEFADYMIANNLVTDEPIWLYGCSTGSGNNSFAQQLSGIMNCEVKAPSDDTILRDDLGVVFIGSPYKNLGYWRTFVNGVEVENDE